MTISPLTLLLVEDHLILRSSLREALQVLRPNFVFHEAGNGKQAIEFVQNNPCDLILMDLQMPEMGGIEAIHLIRTMELPNQPKILVLSSFDQFAFIHDAFLAGANGYALKNIAIGELASALDAIEEGDLFIHAKIRNGYLRYAATKQDKLHPDIALLSEQEKMVLRLVCHDLNNHEIASRLNIEYSTVAKHKMNIKSVIGAKTPAGIVNFALFHGIISKEEMFQSDSFPR